MPARVDPERRRRYTQLRRDGHGLTAASRAAGVSRGWARTFENTIREELATGCRYHGCGAPPEVLWCGDHFTVVVEQIKKDARRRTRPHAHFGPED